MRVLFMSNIPSPYRVAFFNELGKKCDLTVAFEGRSATDRDEKWKADHANNFLPMYLKGVRATSDSFFCPGIIKILKQPWDKIIIGVYSTPTSMLAIEYLRYKKKKFYIEADGGLIKADRRLVYLIKKHFISAASGWFSSGQMTTDYLVHYGARRESCFWYPFSSVGESDIHCKNKRETKEKKVLYVGQLIPRKGIDILLKAATYLDENIIIQIVGGRPSDEYLNMVNPDVGAKVEFVDFMGKDQLKEYYDAADVFVLPTREDIWGLVINEAMAHGLPIITTDRCVAGSELVENGVNGYIIPVNDAKTLAQKILYILDHDEERVLMSRNNLNKSRIYTIEEMAKRHMDVIESILE